MIENYVYKVIHLIVIRMNISQLVVMDSENGMIFVITIIMLTKMDVYLIDPLLRLILFVMMVSQ